MSLLNRKVAIITGGARGIGAHAAQSFAELGAKGIVIPDINLEAAAKTAEIIQQKTGCECIAVKTDVSSEIDVNNVFDITMKKFGTVDILVNNAGISKTTPMDELTMEEWDRMLNINLKGTFLFARAAVKIMKQNKSGKIINMASLAARLGGMVASADYVASKAGVLLLTKTFAKAAAPYNINVNCVAPGLIDTEMTKDFGYQNEWVPLGRIGTPEEVSDVIVFLASDMSRYITGQCIDVNGGIYMN